MQNKYNDIFHYVDGKLFVENVKCEDLLNNYNGPIFAYSKKRIIDNIMSIKTAFLSRYPKTAFYFAYKACYLPGILSIIKENGLGAEVSSSYEYAMAKKNEVVNIVWNGSGKSINEMNNLINYKICWNVDSLEEAICINEIAKEANICVNIGMRIMPEIQIDCSYIERGGKLGIDVASGQAMEVCKKIQELNNVKLVGLHCHLSVENITPENHILTMKGLVDFAKRLYRTLGIELEYLSPGGGFGSRNRMECNGKYIDEFAEGMCNVLDGLMYKPSLILEPGRYIVDDAAICIGKILCKKKCWNNNWWITDMGTNVLVTFYGRHYDVVPVVKNGRRKICINIGDRTSSFTGIIKKNAIVQEQDTGDYIAALNCGSYTFSCGQNFMYPITYQYYVVDEDEIELLYTCKTEEQYLAELYND